jgi:hypothetical protein
MFPWWHDMNCVDDCSTSAYVSRRILSNNHSLYFNKMSASEIPDNYGIRLYRAFNVELIKDSCPDLIAVISEINSLLNLMPLVIGSSLD